MLRWFEGFAGALAAGRFAVEPLEGEYPESVGISLFPQLPPWRAEAVTEVRRGGPPGTLAGAAGGCAWQEGWSGACTRRCSHNRLC